MPDQSPTYNLRAVIRETGLQAETIRAWERRYGLPKPQRSSGGHRLYSLHDIQMLKWLTDRIGEGMTISRAVEMWRVLEAEGNDPLQINASIPAPAQHPNGSIDNLRKAWIESCQFFDEQGAERALTQAFAISSPEAACIGILQRGLSEMGELWYAGEVSVQQEHFASALAMRRLHTLIAASPPATRNARLLASCPPGEEHEFGLLLMTFLLRRRGWDVVYLGANVPLQRLQETLRSTSPRLVISLAQTLPSAASLRTVSLFLQDLKVPLAYGGKIFLQEPGLRELISGHFLGESIADSPASVERILQSPGKLGTTLPPETQYDGLLKVYLNHAAQIDASVSRRMEEHGIRPQHLEIANRTFAQHLAAAISLGDIGLLNNSIRWVEGLLRNAGLDSEMVKEFLCQYGNVVEEYLKEQAGPIIGWIERQTENGCQEKTETV
ncbi:MAG: MerR family transcriptional regulator [Chloroflexi bacterium]|nr:MAG: MerR family transcriptional regulator [Chloroflexota bacterium]